VQFHFGAAGVRGVIERDEHDLIFPVEIMDWAIFEENVFNC
jgi:hypothetical protein